MYDYPIVELPNRYFHFENMTDEQFIHFVLENEKLRVERLTDKSIIIMPPTGGTTGIRNNRISAKVYNWAETNGGVAFDSNTMFHLPDDSMRSPDSAWISKERWDTLSKDEQNKIPKICPDFIIELQSETDSILYLKDKMLAWIKNGCRLAFLIVPRENKSYIYKPGKEIIIKTFHEKLSGEDVLPGFELDCKFMLNQK